MWLYVLLSSFLYEQNERCQVIYVKDKMNYLMIML